MERRSNSIIISGILVAFVVSLITASTVEAQTPPFDAGDFLCYSSFIPGTGPTFRLTDQFFENQQHTIFSFLGICASGDKTIPDADVPGDVLVFESPFDFEHHMMRWVIEGPGPVDSAGNPVRVELTDQFGTFEHNVLGAEEIITPATKIILTDPGVPPIEFPPLLDVHWKCYGIDGDPFDRLVFWQDQFEFITFSSLTPELLCAPATKILPDPAIPPFEPEQDVHLKCYGVNPIGIPILSTFFDQFSADGVTVFDAGTERLCTTVQKEIITPPLTNAGDFLCYRHAEAPIEISAPIILSDQFGEQDHTVTEFLGICASGDKTIPDADVPGDVLVFESPFDFEHHMMRWVIEGPAPDVFKVELTDQFGTFEHNVFEAREIITPAFKIPFDGTPEFPPQLDVHWKCYRIDGADLEVPVGWTDQFTNLDFDFLRPTLLCAPATKTLPDPTIPPFEPELDFHLKCYDIPVFTTPLQASFQDQFEIVDIGIANTQKLCTTATKEVISDEPTAELDHYLAYKVVETKNTPKFQKINVDLRDQFDDPGVVNTYQVRMPVALYNPTIKVHGGITTDIIDVDTHFVGYSFIGPQKQVTNILVENQFGEITVDTIRADRLLVPSLKNPMHPVDTTLPLPITVDHFKCYKIKVTLGTPGFMPQQVLLADQFLDRDFTVVKPTRLCNPVEKTVVDAAGTTVTTPINNPDNHLMCYKLEEIADIKPQKNRVWTNNQFEPEVLDVKKPRELCVPSIKTVL